jgi:hypothetical protein
MYVNNPKLKDPAEATFLAGILTKICAYVRSLLMVAAMAIEIIFTLNQHVTINVCNLAEVEVNFEMLSNFHGKK